MFNHLVESGSHTADLRRRGSFFAGTLALYAVLLAIAGVASVYAYDAHLERENFEVTMLTTPVPMPERNPVQPEHAAASQPASADDSRQLSTRTIMMANINQPLTPVGISTKPVNIPPALPNSIIGPVNYDPPGVTMSNHNGIGGGDPNGTGVRVNLPPAEDVPPPIKPTPTPTPVPKMISLPSSVITSKAISKPVPVYPLIAKQAHIYGVVMVEILIDEQGRVISAQATSGHPLLREAARQAALQARFTPTQLNGQPVKVSGVITYNFVLQ